MSTTYYDIKHASIKLVKLFTKYNTNNYLVPKITVEENKENDDGKNDTIVSIYGENGLKIVKKNTKLAKTILNHITVYYPTFIKNFKDELTLYGALTQTVLHECYHVNQNKTGDKADIELNATAMANLFINENIAEIQSIVPVNSIFPKYNYNDAIEIRKHKYKTTTLTGSVGELEDFYRSCLQLPPELYFDRNETNLANDIDKLYDNAYSIYKERIQ